MFASAPWNIHIDPGNKSPPAPTSVINTGRSEDIYKVWSRLHQKSIHDKNRKFRFSFSSFVFSGDPFKLVPTEDCFTRRFIRNRLFFSSCITPEKHRQQK